MAKRKLTPQERAQMERELRQVDDEFREQADKVYGHNIKKISELNRKAEEQQAAIRRKYGQ